MNRVPEGVITHVVFSGGTSVQELDGSNNVPTVEYIRGSDYGGGVGGILYTIRGGTPSYTHENKRGDVVAKTDGTGTLTYQAQYEAFGKQTATSGSTLDRQKSNSKDTDPTGLVDEGRRYRDLDTGMFINRDPAGFVDGPNLYIYVVQNPWTKFDPEGLWSTTGFLEDSVTNIGEGFKGVAEGFVGAGQATGQALVTGGEGIFNGQAVQAAENLYNAPKGAVSNAIKQDASAAATQFAQNATTPEGFGKNVGAAATLLTGAVKAPATPKPIETPPPGAQSAASTTAESVDLQLHYKEGWTDDQKAAADAKVDALNAADGKVVVKDPARSTTAASTTFKKAGGQVPAGSDVDHTVDLQLGGKDTVSNMLPLDSSVNRSLGAQINNRIRDLPAGTPVGKITITDKPKN